MSQLVGYGPLQSYANKVDEAVKGAQTASEAAQTASEAAQTAAEAAQTASEALKTEVNLIISTANGSTETTFEADLFNAFTTRTTLE